MAKGDRSSGPRCAPATGPRLIKKVMGSRSRRPIALRRDLLRDRRVRCCAALSTGGSSDTGRRPTPLTSGVEQASPRRPHDSALVAAVRTQPLEHNAEIRNQRQHRRCRSPGGVSDRTACERGSTWKGIAGKFGAKTGFPTKPTTVDRLWSNETICGQMTCSCRIPRTCARRLTSSPSTSIERSFNSSF